MSPCLFWFLATILVGLFAYGLLAFAIDWALQDDADEHAELDARQATKEDQRP